MAKGKFTRVVEDNSDGTITINLMFHYQGNTKGLKNEDFSKLENSLKYNFNGFVGFDTIMVLDKEVFLDIKIKRVNNEPITVDLYLMELLIKQFINVEIGGLTNWRINQ